MMLGNLMASPVSLIRRKISVKFSCEIAMLILSLTVPNLPFVRIFIVAHQVERDSFLPAQHCLEVTVVMEDGAMEDRV
jgi:hypothetical protein